MQDIILIACAGFLLVDETHHLLAPQRCVVGFAHRQEVWGQISHYHLPSIYKDVSGKEAKSIHTWRDTKTLYYPEANFSLT